MSSFGEGTIVGGSRSIQRLRFATACVVVGGFVGGLIGGIIDGRWALGLAAGVVTALVLGLGAYLCGRIWLGRP